MATRQRRPSRLRRLLLPATTALVLTYFGYHAVTGAYGLAGRAALEHRAADLETALAAVEAENAGLEHRIALLQPEAVDPDYLDELIRRQLGYAQPNDIIVPSAQSVSGR
jgi:cell division protein FtsB